MATKCSRKEQIERWFIPEPNTGCWLWIGVANKNNGRPQIWWRENGLRKSEYAYRTSYRLFKGEIPEGLLVCHHCDQPLCVNPDHLFAGTQSDNLFDMYRKGRRPRVFSGVQPWKRKAA